MTCEEVRLALGAHALGALDSDEAMEIDTHLATCEVCGAELLELEGVAGFLGKVSERDVELVASPPRQVLDRLLNDRARRNRRGRLVLVAAASAAVLALGGTIWTTIRNEQPPSMTAATAPSATPTPEQAAPLRADAKEESSSAQLDMRQTPSASKAPKEAISGREFTGANRARDYRATVMAWPRDGGTELGVTVTGVPVGTSCRLVVVGANGQRDTTESWVVSREAYQDNAAFKSVTKLPMSAITRFDVIDQTGKVLISVATRK
jgi:hypothetical protein